MPSFEHGAILQRIAELDDAPDDQEDFATWIQARAHIEFLCNNALSNELVVFCSGSYSFVHSAVVPLEYVASASQDELLEWCGDPYSSNAGYAWGSGRDDVWVDRLTESKGSGSLKSEIQLVFGRTFEGWSGSDHTYFEINQEYAHVTGIHWRPEHRAYCCYDENGDLQQVVSVTCSAEERPGVWCASFAWEPLEEYLAATQSCLVRRFDFTLLRQKNFSGWPSGPETTVRESDSLVYRQKVIKGHAAYTAGVQIVEPRRARKAIFQRIRGGHKEMQYAKFLICDWRNQRIIKASTDPKATTSYYNANANSLPFEVSPAFFRPEVILKYKGDKDKYTVGERDITCRSAWHLQAFDTNEAGQVFAYIRYLRNLPYSEQLHWQSYNEAPKAGISERAITNDFNGQFTTFISPVQEILSIMESWRVNRVSWWTLRDDRLPERVSTPLTTSRDEWAEAFMDLAKLVIEGFEIKTIRARLGELDISYDKGDGSLILLERLISNLDFSNKTERLATLRTVQLIRTKVKGHASGKEVEELVGGVIAKHGSFTNHFQNVCEKVTIELQMVAGAFE